MVEMPDFARIAKLPAVPRFTGAIAGAGAGGVGVGAGGVGVGAGGVGVGAGGVTGVGVGVVGVGVGVVEGVIVGGAPGVITGARTAAVEGVCEMVGFNVVAGVQAVAKIRVIPSKTITESFKNLFI
ncbi:MAG: hypothetical protein Q7J73_03250 [Dehalococcoidales bacterium]|nr:hypothetical protein [Dehalococcoidales bacterium]